MHLALVHPVRESTVRELAPNGYGPAGVASSMRKPWRPLARVKLGFEGELGHRLEAALVEAERLVELLELAVPAHRAHVEELYRSLPGGVREPLANCDLAQDDKSALARPVHDAGALAADPSWRPWEAFVGPRVAVDHEEDPMGSKPVFYTYQGKQMRAGELAELPEAIAASLDRNTIHLRLVGGWPIEKAISTPKSGKPATREARPSKPPPAPKAKRKPAAPKPTLAQEVRSTARAVAASLDPLELLTRLGIAHEDLGATPKGRLVLLTEAPV
jgi:hypothetical protein